jgi:hypothetical protein
MLLQNYTYYLWRIASAGLLTFSGILSIVLLIAAIALWVKFDSSSKLRTPGYWLLLIAAIGCFMVAFNNATYEFNEDPDSLVIESLPAGEPDCGTALSKWIRGGYGIPNACPKGCYRGKVLRKAMRMRGMPPWPEYRRELACWQR